MELQKLISDILDGKVCALPFNNVDTFPEKGVTSCALSALNFARLAFAVEGGTPVLSKIITSLCSRKTVENTFAICREWNGDANLQVEDVYQTPLFEASLRLLSTDHSSPTFDHPTRLLGNLHTLSSSAAVLISRHSNTVACLRLRTTAQNAFVLFNPRTISGDKQVASLTFCISLPQIIQQLRDIFPTARDQITQGDTGLQGDLLGKHAAHVFVPKAVVYDSRMGEDTLLVSSLTILAMRAELEELTQNNDSLKKEKQRLEKGVTDLKAQLETEKFKTRRAQFSKPPVAKAKTTHIAYNTRRPQFAERSYPARQSENRIRTEDVMDPSIQFALQLQATFDSENELLLKQKHVLMQTAQRQYHCGICLDDFPEDDAVHIDACGHDICRDCARGHVCAKIEEHRFPVLCPVCMADAQNKHPGTISGTLVELLGVSEKQWETWVEMELAQFSIPFTCRKCQHSAFVDKQDLEEDTPEFHCPFPTCDHVWCKKCQQTIEPEGPKHSCDGTSELDHLMKQQGWRYCPNCKTPIQKSMGCNHLSCIAPGCNTHFCYRCGETINRTAIPAEIQEGKTAHFRNCTII